MANSFEFSNGNLITIFLLGLAILFVTMNCKFSCGKNEGFFGDEINDPYAVDYAHMPRFDNPANLRYGQPKTHVPVEDSTSDHTYPGLSGYIHRPACDRAY